MTRSVEDVVKVRVAAIVEALSKGEHTPEELFEAFHELDGLPADQVREAFRGWLGELPDLARLDDTIRRAHGLPLRPLRLLTLSSTRDADVLFLGPVAEEQVRLAGRAWDGVDRPAEDRLDGEIEGSFAGSLEHRVLGDADAPGVEPLFDVLRYEGDSGTIFRAGTAVVVGAIAYGNVEMKDVRVRTAIQEAVAAEVEPEEVAPVTATDPPPPSAPAEKTDKAKKAKKPRARASTKPPAPKKKAAPAKKPSKRPAAAKKATSTKRRSTP